ncbi:BadF/BadG/BcrA/BcrD ATPase family protein [Paragemmobacter straminiformis]|uniref:ATPase n=1 Tax=Paragemmobacter straminiformis TaxID=2045119 RepID=A0A842I9C6_9RHOB|nr:BadF/BadG/BcrA/BcrD ATPase family protein [Gemmobacter straminiformis]MBC2836191.1 ATPase [Gemmobacter straminiformis]
MTLFLGIDGGGTGCRAAVADASGRILGRGEAGPANIASDPATATTNILTASKAALAAAGGGSIRSAALGLAGANAAGAAHRLQDALPFARLTVVTDAVTAVKGALGAQDGVVAALGTGSVFASQQNGRLCQIGGYGLALGDEGSGAWLGRALLSRCLRALDGFTPMTPLLRAVLAEHGGADAIVAFSLAARPADFATLAPRLVGSADPAAQAIMAQATADIAASIARLQPPEPLAVTFLGGLGPAFAARLPQWPQRAALGTALDGALLLAREAA